MINKVQEQTLKHSGISLKDAYLSPGLLPRKKLQNF